MNHKLKDNVFSKYMLIAIITLLFTILFIYYFVTKEQFIITQPISIHSTENDDIYINGITRTFKGNYFSRISENSYFNKLFAIRHINNTNWILAINQKGETKWLKKYECGIERDCLNILNDNQGFLIMEELNKGGDTIVNYTRMSTKGEIIWNKSFTNEWPSVALSKENDIILFHRDAIENDSCKIKITSIGIDGKDNWNYIIDQKLFDPESIVPSKNGFYYLAHSISERKIIIGNISKYGKSIWKNIYDHVDVAEIYYKENQGLYLITVEYDNDKAYLYSLNLHGGVIWEKTFKEYLYSIKVTPLDGGNTFIERMIDNHKEKRIYFKSKIFTSMLDKDGRILWEDIYDGFYNTLNTIKDEGSFFKNTSFLPINDYIIFSYLKNTKKDDGNKEFGNKIIAFNNFGEMKWTYEALTNTLPVTLNNAEQGILLTTCNIGNENNSIFKTNKLFYISTEGKILWNKSTTNRASKKKLSYICTNIVKKINNDIIYVIETDCNRSRSNQGR